MRGVLTYRMECTECGGSFQRLASHWARSSCDYPTLTSSQKDVLDGLVMGDAYVVKNNTDLTPYLRVRMITPEYLYYLDSILSPISSGKPTLYMTAEESAEQAESNGLRESADPENYHPVYEWCTRSIPHLSKYDDWYLPEGKVFPDNITMSPEKLRSWYCCDGTIQANRIAISCTNEMNNYTKLSNYFTDIGLPEPTWSQDNMRFSAEDTVTVFDYMGQASPGFEYKWLDG